ncbi:MAG TPA: DUF3067 family protein [Candidatus Obscuribacterales bacterium]
MTGEELHQLLMDKWGRSYDLQLRRIQDQVFLQVMWKYLEQVSFPRSEADYFAHLEAIAHYMNAWGSEQYIRQYIEQTRDRPRLGKAVSIPIDLGERASEWLLEF